MTNAVYDLPLIASDHMETPEVPPTSGPSEANIQSIEGGNKVLANFRNRRAMAGVGLVLVVALGTGLMWGSRFTTNMVHNELVAQKISFPPRGSAALSPKDYPGLQRYGSQAVDNGPKAKAFANQFIAEHLKGVASGKTYAEVSNASRANPTDQKLVQQRQTLFEGQTLRGMLLSAWGWSVVGRITGLVAFGAFAIAAVLLAELVYSFIAHHARSAAPTPSLAMAGHTA